MHVMGMCQAMAKLGHEVSLYVRPGELVTEDDFDFYGVEAIFKLSKQSRPQVRGWGALVNALDTRRVILDGVKPDLIYARETWALSLVADLGVPFVFESHWAPVNLVHKIAEARLLRSPLLDRVVFISEALRQIYLERFRWLDPALALVAHDAADLPDSTKERDVFEIGQGAGLQIGYVGSFQPGCGVDLLAEISVLRPSDEFHVFGGSPEEVGERSARTAQIKNLHFHGFVAPSKLPGIYRALDVVLAPYQATTRSIDWASPMKLFEYMAHGKAIICSDFPVLREVIENGVTGVLVRPDCLPEWARAIQNFNDDESLLRGISNAGHESFKRNFTWLRRAERIIDGLRHE
jgi:glycosyltransferase involved in cell wall biosynthesis